MNKKLAPVFLILYLLTLSLGAQDSKSSEKESINQSFSVFTGGFIIKNSILSTTKLGYEFKHFGLLADLTYDDYKETWDNGSKSAFRLFGISLSGRYYLRPLGRSLFAEANVGIGRPVLVTRESGNKIVKKDLLPCTGFGLGWRFGKKPTGIFGEVGYRMTFSLKDSHLYTSAVKPDPKTIENISYQSWLFEKGKGTGQIYLGVGYSF